MPTIEMTPKQTLRGRQHTFTAKISNGFSGPIYHGTIPVTEFVMVPVPNPEFLNDRPGYLGIEKPLQRTLNLSQAFSVGRYIASGLMKAVFNNPETPDDVKECLESLIAQNADARMIYALPSVVLATVDDDGSGSIQADYGDNVCSLSMVMNRSITIDGQHRQAGYKLVANELMAINMNQEYPKASKLFTITGRKNLKLTHTEAKTFERLYAFFQNLTIGVEVHLNKTPAEVRQIWSDYNDQRLAVSKALSQDFDMANPVNNFSKGLASVIRINTSKNSIGFDAEDQGEITLKELNSVNSQLFLGRSDYKKATAKAVRDLESYATRFWEAVSKSPNFGSARAMDLTLLSQPVMLQACAKLVRELVGFSNPKKRDEASFQKLLDGIESGSIDFSHDNMMFRYLSLSAEERSKHGLDNLKDYLPEFDDSVAREIGTDDARGKLHFATRRNDVRPLLNDMIRWKLGLPIRTHKKPKKAS